MRQNGNIRQNSQESGKIDPAIKKGYEIAYAIFRIVGKIQSEAFKEAAERQALKLLDATVTGNVQWANSAADGIHYLSQFGKDIGIIHPANEEVIIQEIAALKNMLSLSESTNPAMVPEEVPLGDIFLVKQENLFSVNGNLVNGNPATGNAAKVNPTIRQDRQERQDAGESTTGNSAMRQSAILEKIRQSGNCRLKDILEVLPDTSERTIRYDLQSLVEQNLVERVGAGGPTVFYRIR